MAKKEKKHSKGKERPPPVELLIKPAIGIALALLAYQFISGIKSEVRICTVVLGRVELDAMQRNLLIGYLSMLSLSITLYFYRSLASMSRMNLS
jgi:hypothetical protein